MEFIKEIIIVYSREIAVALKWVVIIFAVGKLLQKASDFLLTDIDKIKKHRSES